MKNHIAIKFLALALCAAALLGAITSGGGILCMFALDLYDRTPDDYYVEVSSRQAKRYASDLVSWYASQTLGNCPDTLIRDYFGLREMENEIASGDLEYELIDPGTGEILDSQYSNKESSKPWQEMPGIGGYLLVVEDPAPAETIGETQIQVTAPPEETEAEPTTTEPTPAEKTAEPAEQAQPEPSAAPEAEAAGETEPLVQIQPESTGETESRTSPEETAPEPDTVPESTEASESQPETLPESTEQVTEAATETPAIDEEDTFLVGAWDPERMEHRAFRVSYQKAPEYVVRLRMMNVGNANDAVWEMLRMVWNVRFELYKVLGVCLAAFAVLLVYLCCAAGRKPGTTEIQAGGLNRLPLDGYLVGLAIVVGCAIVLIPELVDLMGYTMEGAVALYVGAGYTVCLLIVHFFFALAAQVKTPGHYLVKHSLCGYGIRLIVWGWNLMITILAWSIRTGRKWMEKLVPLGLRLLRALWKLVKFFWGKTMELLRWTLDKAKKLLSWCWKKFLRFVNMLPLTWQWLLAGFAMIFILSLTVSSYRGGIVVLGIGASLALVLYGASAFGTLLENAKRMRQGDLDTKVDDSLLIGSFREFAGELNGLADVAVVAAQKQLKSERMKTELITNVSHDIKTPLTSIINYVDLMKMPHSPQEQEMYLEVLSRQSQRLKKLIDDLMEMSKASTGNLTVEIGMVDAAEAVNQALGEFADKLEAAPLHPVFKAPEKQVLMLADGRLVWRVLSNALSNACKYALPGTRLYIDLTVLEEKVIISLKNISREELNVEADELMERFVRGDASRNTEGSGLGLNIAKSLMHLQKGDLQLLVDGDLFKVTLIFPGA